jgi:hypothetical protein
MGPFYQPVHYFWQPWEYGLWSNARLRFSACESSPRTGTWYLAFHLMPHSEGSDCSRFPKSLVSSDVAETSCRQSVGITSVRSRFSYYLSNHIFVENPRASCQMLVADKRHCLAFQEPLIDGNVVVDFGILSPTVLSKRGLYRTDLAPVVSKPPKGLRSYSALTFDPHQQAP